MKRGLQIGVILTNLLIVACNPFEKDRVMNYKSELVKIVDIIDEHHEDVLWFDSDDIPEIIELDIDFVVRKKEKKTFVTQDL